VKCEEAMPVAANEVYFRTWRGRWCFLPAIPCLCGGAAASLLSVSLPYRALHASRVPTISGSTPCFRHDSCTGMHGMPVDLHAMMFGWDDPGKEGQ
jgi:hypothetical protein